MPLNLNKVHDYRRVKGQPSVARLESTSFYFRAVNGKRAGNTTEGGPIWDTDPPIICQGGEYYSDGGDRIAYKNVPEWFWERVRVLPKHRRDVYGIVLPEEKQTKRKSEKTEETEPVLSE